MVEKQTLKETAVALLKAKFLSRKLLVWITATVLLVLKVISEEVWMYTSMVYIGVNSALAAIAVIKRKGGEIDLTGTVEPPKAETNGDSKLPPP
jgi:hypothetical protein